jgi:hypothetical protein
MPCDESEGLSHAAVQSRHAALGYAQRIFRGKHSVAAAIDAAKFFTHRSEVSASRGNRFSLRSA